MPRGSRTGPRHQGDDPLTRSGRVAFGGIVKQINLAFAPEATVGDYVLVHAGVAIAILDEAEAARTLACLDTLEEEDGAVKYLDEYRDPGAARRFARAIAALRHPALDPDGNLRRADPFPRCATASTRCCRQASPCCTGRAARSASPRAAAIDQAIALAATPGRDPVLLRRHAARAGRGRQPAGGESARRRRADGLFPARRGGARPGASRTRSGVLRRRLRDHRARHRHGGAAGRARRPWQLQPARRPCPGPAGDRGAAELPPTTRCRASSPPAMSAP